MPHVLKNICYEQDEVFTYLLSPLCEYSLSELIEDKDCPLRKILTDEKRLQLCIQFLQGLTEVHAAGILHRNIKPENVLLDADGNVFLSDIGISRQLPIGKTTMGTLCWSSTQSLKDVNKYKKSSDIQVAGFLVHYILTDGHHPYQTMYPFDRDPPGLMTNIKKGQYSLGHLPNKLLHSRVASMICVDANARPPADECVQLFQTYLRVGEDVRHTQEDVRTTSGKMPFSGRWTESLMRLREGKGNKEINGLIYNRLHKIADGSYGSQIFVGLKDDNPVAVKRVNSDFVQTELDVFHHLQKHVMPHVLKNICYEQDEVFTYLLSPLCEYSLSELIEDKDCPLRKILTDEKRLQLCIQFLQGLTEVHAAGILHRNIKPENVLLDTDGNVFLSDFGMRRQFPIGKTTMGTLCWSSTQSLEDVNEYKKSSDIQLQQQQEEGSNSSRGIPSS
ncbi:uncharacterized protein [Ptychodera flava]|uniref:uncharacterized protein n=1 Tax=Ptychodera flava TaxID=63121 RepID=UPI00396A0EC1